MTSLITPLDSRSPWSIVFRKKSASPVRAPDMPANDGAYKISVSLTSGGVAWEWDIYDRKGKCKYNSYTYIDGCTPEEAKERAFKKARKWIDAQLEKDRIVAEYGGQPFEEWYGITPEVARKTIETQKTYIEQLEEKLDEFRGPDGRLDADRMVPALN